MATMGEIVAQPEIKADQGDRLRNRHGVEMGKALALAA